MRARPNKKLKTYQNRHFDMPRVYPASERQIELVKDIAEKIGIEPPETLNRDTCRQFINNHIRKLAPPRKRGGWS